MTTECRFYDAIYPAFENFQQKRNVLDPFDNAPKHFKVNLKQLDVPPIILENLRCLGYTLRDRKKAIDDDHLRLPIKAFAKDHAISLAMKDQEPETFKNLTDGIIDYFSINFIKYGLSESIKNCVKQFKETLDPDNDKEMLECCKTLGETLVNSASKITENVDEYDVLGQGDSWSSNMMFIYKDGGVAIDVKLIDWQCQRLGSPLLLYISNKRTFRQQRRLPQHLL
ncbi:uncharacterized protein [Onthophagus taurus]|uniref:uncharacterized protein n=1 Tax=Onthophagus taurus TaxID=166361 RepID=UPI0039BE4CCD